MNAPSCPPFSSTGCNDAFCWELPSCGSFDASSFFIQGGDNSRAAQCQHCGSWLKYCLNTDKKAMQSETTSEWSALLAMLLHHCFQQEAQYLNACDGKSGNPIKRWFPSVSCSLLTLLNPFTSKTGTYNLYWERQENTFSASWISHLSSNPSVNVSLMCRYKSEISLILNNDYIHSLSYSSRRSCLLIGGNTYLAHYMSGPLQYL